MTIRQMNMTLNKEAMKAYRKFKKLGVIDESIGWICRTVMDQEVVSFQTSKGTITFDEADVVHRGSSLQGYSHHANTRLINHGK